MGKLSVISLSSFADWDVIEERILAEPFLVAIRNDLLAGRDVKLGWALFY
ncbi:hypothetical protein Sjap_005057 [Stephania japonica]|uniref:Uncharacterized protein n=1 Tax=Stephania japonica TaxID=461633 RepID=A0AAP0K4Q6_9MAGN